MQKIIKGHAIVEDGWTLLPKDYQDELPQKPVLAPLNYWLRENPAPSEQLGLWLDSDEDAATVGEAAKRFPVIAVNFPGFVDGRGFSIGRLLRERYHFDGELRAIGAIRDQLFYLQRCGFDAFDIVTENYPLEEALASLNDFSVTYQASVDQPQPLFRRR